MASTRAVWGIDIGQCALKAIRIRAVGDKLEVLGHEYIEHEKILSWPDTDRATLINKAMEQLLSRHDLRQDLVVVGVPGQHTLTRFPKLPPVDAKKIPDIVQFEANQQIPFDMDEVIWDYQTFGNPETKEIEVGIFAMRRELVAEHLRPFVAAGIEPVVVQSNPLALYSAMRYDGLLGDDLSLTVDIGTQNTDLIIADKYTLWTRNLPLGGNNFTDALYKAFKTALPKAETLKRTAASSKYARQIFQAMRPVFADLVAEIQRSMGFYSSTHRGARVTRVIAMGNAFKLPGLQKFLNSNLNIEVVRPTTFNKLSTASAENAPRLLEHLMGFGVAYGLALQGLGLGEITANLLPPEIARGIVWRKKMPWFWGAAASLALASLLVWGRFLWDSRALASAAGPDPAALTPRQIDEAEARREIQTPPAQGEPPMVYAARMRDLATSLDKVYQEYKQKGTEEENKCRDILKVQQDKLVWPRILQEIHNALPRPQPALAAAIEKGPEALAEAVKSNADLARPERRQVFINSLSVLYGENVGDLMARTRSTLPRGMGGMEALGGLSPAPAEGAAPAATGPGFVVRLTGTTPHKGSTRFLEDELLKNLAKVTQKSKPQRGFYFVVEPGGRAIVSCEPVSKRGGDDSMRSGGGSLSTGGAPGLEAPPGGGFGFGGGTAGLGARTIDTRVGGDIDPVTGEPTGNDWAFEIVFQVVLAPPEEGSGAAPQ